MHPVTAVEGAKGTRTAQAARNLLPLPPPFPSANARRPNRGVSPAESPTAVEAPLAHFWGGAGREPCPPSPSLTLPALAPPPLAPACHQIDIHPPALSAPPPGLP